MAESFMMAKVNHGASLNFPRNSKSMFSPEKLLKEFQEFEKVALSLVMLEGRSTSCTKELSEVN